MIQSPCKGCPRRFVGCHTICPEYVDFRAKVDAANAKERAARDAEKDVVAHTVQNSDNIKKSRRRNG